MYTGDVGFPLNQGMADGTITPQSPFPAVLTEALLSIQPLNGTFYRGPEPYDPPLSFFQNNVGREFSPNYFFSTASEPVTASTFQAQTMQRHDENAFNYMFVIYGQSGRLVKTISSVADENEATFLPGTRFRILKVGNESPARGISPRPVVYLEEVRR